MTSGAPVSAREKSKCLLPDAGALTSAVAPPPPPHSVCKPVECAFVFSPTQSAKEVQQPPPRARPALLHRAPRRGRRGHGAHVSCAAPHHPHCADGHGGPRSHQPGHRRWPRRGKRTDAHRARRPPTNRHAPRHTRADPLARHVKQTRPDDHSPQAHVLPNVRRRAGPSRTRAPQGNSSHAPQRDPRRSAGLHLEHPCQQVPLVVLLRALGAAVAPPPPRPP